MRSLLKTAVLLATLALTGNISYAQITGTVAVPSATYPDLASVVTALNTQGVGTGGATINLAASTPQTAPAGGYQLGSAVLNASLTAANPLTINGGSNTVTSNTGTGNYDGIFVLKGTDYVTINALNLVDAAANTTAATQMEWGYALLKLNAAAPFDGCRYNKIQNCTITLKAANALSVGIYAAHITTAGTALATAGTAPVDANSYNQFSGNTISGVTKGIYLTGISTGAATYDKANIVGGAGAGNTISVGGTTNVAYGVQTAYDSVITFQGNAFSIATGQNAVVYEINTGTGVGNLNVINNTFNVACSITTSNVSGFYNSSAHADAGSTTTITGNTVTGDNTASTTGYLYGIYNYYNYCTNETFSNNKAVNINWGASTGYMYLLYNYYGGTTNLTADGNSLNNIYKVNTSTTTSYIYGIYIYNYNATTGVFTYTNNKVKNVRSSAYYNYLQYAYGSGTSPYQKVSSKYNRTDSVDVSSSGYCYLYNYFAYYAKDSSEISYDTVSNITSVNPSGGSVTNYFGYLYYGLVASTSQYNYVNNINNSTPSVSNYMGYYHQMVQNNIISNITTTTGSITNQIGYYGTNAIAQNNTINNLNTASGYIYNYLAYYGTNNEFRYNTVTNLNISGSSTLYNYLGYYGTGFKVHHNNIGNLTTGSGTCYAAYVYSTSGAADSFYNNNIYNVSVATGSVSGTIYMLYAGGTADVGIYNNFLSNLNTPSTYASNGLYGIYLNSGPNFKVYHNTVYIKPIGSATTFGVTGVYYPNSTTGSLDLRNNIIHVNSAAAGAGTVVALRRASGTAGTVPSNLAITTSGNIYYAPNAANSYLYGEGISSTTMVNAYNLTNDPAFNTPCGLYKTFMAGREGASFTENNLIAGTLANTYVPASPSYAKSVGVATTNPAVTFDYANAARPATNADAGALQFVSTALDAAAPVIAYTPLPTTTYCLASPTLTATITDATGVNTATGTAPRIYYKKSTELNVFGGTNNSSFNGWKWVEATNTGSTFTFVPNYGLLFTPIAVGDSIVYFVIAQDVSSPVNAGANIAGFPSGFCPSTVALTSAAGPIAASPAANGYKILALPAITVNAAPAQLCLNGTSVLTLSTAPNGLGVQWQQDNGTGTFVNITGATSTTYTTPTLFATNNYRAQFTCGGSVTYTTATQTITVNNPAVTGTTPATRCGLGTVNLMATGSTGSALSWYTAATGGTALYTGNTFTTPAIGASTTYYVGANSGGGTANVGKASTTGADAYNTGTGSWLIFDATTAFTLQSVVVYPYSATAGTAGTATIAVQNSAGVTLQSATVNVVGYPTPTPQIVTLNLPVTPGTAQRLNLSGLTGVTGFYRDYSAGSGIAFPYTLPGVVSITGGSLAGYYYYFYNWTVTTGCESARTAVTATVTPAPTLSVTSPQLPGVCAGTSITANVSSANGGYTYVWAPGGQTSTTISTTPTTTTTYVVTATDNSGGANNGCSTKDSVTLAVNPVPAVPVITPASSTICQGSQVTLTSSTVQPISTKWINLTSLYKNAGLTVPVTSTDTVKVVYAAPATTQSYTGVAYIQGCSSAASVAAVVNVNPLPIATFTASPSATICAGQTTVLTAGQTGTGYTYQWSNASGAIAGATGNTYTTGTAGAYKVTVTNTATTCAATTATATTVVVNPLPTATATITGASTVCNGSTVQLDANTGTGLTYQWLNNGSPVTGAASATYYATTTGNYAVVVTNSNGCSATSNQVSATVNVTPAVITPQGTTTFCTGYNVVLQANTGANLTYVWYIGTTAITGATGSSYTASASGNYSVVVTNTSTGCSTQSAPVTVTVGAPPTSNITPTGAVGVCDGNSYTLSTNPALGLAYQWYLNGNAITGANGQTYTRIYTLGAGGGAGSYTVNVSSGVGCSSTTTTPTVVTVNPLPAITVTASGATTFCQGNTVTLTAASGTTGLTYQWYNGATAITGATGTTYVAGASGSYTVRGTNGNGCIGTSNAVSVTVNPLPVVTATAATATTFCQGNSVVLNAAPATGLTYQWTSNTNNIAGATGSSYSATASGNYSVTVTNSNGCVNTSNVIPVTVNPLPNVTLTPAGTINVCSGSTTTISVPAASGQTYQWSNGAGVITGATNPTYTTGTAGIYSTTVKITATGCQATSAIDSVVVNPLPTSVATIAGPTTICQGDTAKLIAGSGAGYTYQWRLNGNAIIGATGQVYNAQIAGTYTVATTNSFGCTVISNGITITVNPAPAAYITYNTPLSFCDGGAVVLNANAGTGLTYTWIYNGVAVGNTTASNIAAQQGVYNIKVTNTFGCSTISAPENVTVWQVPQPVIVMNNYVLSTGTYATYQWFYNNNPIPGAVTQAIQPIGNGFYKVMVKDVHSCQSTSEQFFVNGLGVTSTVAVRNAIKVYPNPASSILHVDAPVKVNLVLRDVMGRTVLAASGAKEMDVTNMANGIYVLYINDAEGHTLKVEKVTKTNE